MLVGDGESMPELYADPVYKRAKTWVLSTSAVFSKHFHPYGWGEVVPNGFGVAYMTGFDGMSALVLRASMTFYTYIFISDYLQYTITSRTEMPNNAFCQEIERAADELYDLHAATTKSPSSKL